MKCVAHLVGFPWECQTPEECEKSSGPAEFSFHDSVLDDNGNVASSVVETEEEELESRTTYKDDSALRDQQSTGRKRAARWFPLDETKQCEWSFKANAGGGKFPIVGCTGNLQQARHHGPDKNTLNNEEGNVHRICHTCHNRWHTLNDPNYVWGHLYDAHAPVVATAEDLLNNEIFWKDRKVVKAKD